MRHLLGTLVVALGLIASACSGEDKAAPTTMPSAPSADPAGASTDSLEPTDVVASGLVAFCAEFNRLGGQRPQEYIGSSEHVADIDAMLAVAPDSIARQVRALRDYLASGAVDGESDPESSMFENWPPDIQSAVLRIQEFGSVDC